jgi:hypothetical protein
LSAGSQARSVAGLLRGDVLPQYIEVVAVVEAVIGQLTGGIDTLLRHDTDTAMPVSTGRGPVLT